MRHLGAMKSATELMHTYLYEVAINERLDLIDEIAASDLVDEANAIFGGPPGREGLKAHVRGFRKYVQDCRIDVHKIVGAAEVAMGWWSFEGLHVGPWLGKVATERSVTGTVCTGRRVCCSTSVYCRATRAAMRFAKC